MTILERIAKALDEVTTGPDAGNFPVSELFTPEVWAVIRSSAAKAVLLAMREPTGFMIDEAWASALAENPADVWRDMIDAALEEK